MDRSTPVVYCKSRIAKNAALARAVRIAGGQAALAAAINKRQPTVWGWLYTTGEVSASNAIAIERATGVPAEQICPALREYAQMRGLPVREAA